MIFRTESKVTYDLEILDRKRRESNSCIIFTKKYQVVNAYSLSRKYVTEYVTIIVFRIEGNITIREREVNEICGTHKIFHYLGKYFYIYYFFMNI